MTNLADEKTASRDHLPGIWEALRAVSGLVAVIALTIVVAAAALRDAAAPGAVASGRAGGNVSSEAPGLEPGARSIEGARQSSHTSAPAVRLTSFYIVASEEQARLAAWVEQTAAVEAAFAGYGPDLRHSQTIFVEEGNGEAAAAEAILRHILALGEPSLFYLTDLRAAGMTQPPPIW